MRFLRRFLARLKNFATGRQDDQRLREEMEEHLAQQTAENLRAGSRVGAHLQHLRGRHALREQELLLEDQSAPQRHRKQHAEQPA